MVFASSICRARSIASICEDAANTVALNALVSFSPHVTALRPSSSTSGVSVPLGCHARMALMSEGGDTGGNGGSGGSGLGGGRGGDGGDGGGGCARIVCSASHVCTYASANAQSSRPSQRARHVSSTGAPASSAIVYSLVLDVSKMYPPPAGTPGHQSLLLFTQVRMRSEGYRTPSHHCTS